MASSLSDRLPGYMGEKPECDIILFSPRWSRPACCSECSGLKGFDFVVLLFFALDELGQLSLIHEIGNFSQQVITSAMNFCCGWLVLSLSALIVK